MAVVVMALSITSALGDVGRKVVETDDPRREHVAAPCVRGNGQAVAAAVGKGKGQLKLDVVVACEGRGREKEKEKEKERRRLEKGIITRMITRRFSFILLGPRILPDRPRHLRVTLRGWWNDVLAAELEGIEMPRRRRRSRGRRRAAEEEDR
jgi:hypothetical protein